MRKILPLSFALACVAWAVFTWPLPVHVRSGIPSSASNIEAGHVRNMIAGDHLQILYHFWLFQDSLFGPTPWFTDPYEFRMSDAAPPRRIRSYYVPFSVPFAIVAPFGGRALAWNLTGLLTVWVSCLGAWLLAAAYTRDKVLAAAAACVGLVMPFRWHALMGGSPTGLALCLLPLMLLGIDGAVRKARPGGAVLAGLALLAASTSDRHVFFFGALLCPFWALFTLVAGRVRDPDPPPFRRVAKALLPLPVLFAAAFAALKATSRHVENSVMAGGRALEEAALFSRTADGVFMPGSVLQAEVHLGIVMPAVVLVCFAALLARTRRKDREAFSSVILLAAAVPAVCLVVAAALGANGPFGGRVFLQCREWIPKYDMIRQPAKVFCLLPAMLPVIYVLAVGPWLRGRSPRVAWAAAVIPVALMFAEERRWVSSTICLLSREHPAYAAAAARTPGEPPPHFVAVPFWPGDSHWSSLYQHYASLYRMPMLNGYNPAVPKRYAEDVYPAVSPVNRGLLGPAEMDVFRDMGITRVILHENAFPEKVSPFPGCFTLRRLLQNPGLRLTASSGGVWAFETGDVAAGASVAVPEWRIYCPGRIWTAPQGRGENVEPVPAADSEGGECLRMAEPPASVSFPGARAVFEPGLRLMFRLRGAGEAGARLFLDGRLCADEAIRVGSDEWAWHEVSVPPFDGQAMIKAAVGLTAGRVDVDSLILAAGEWRNPEGSAPVRIPAPCLFHFGETDLSSNSIILRRDAVASLEAIYGPCMPLDPGEYTVEMKYSSPAPAGVRLGSLALRRGGVNLAESQVEAGRPAVLALNLRDNRSVAVYFLFGWSADVEVLEFVISRGGGDHATGLSEDRAAAD